MYIVHGYILEPFLNVVHSVLNVRWPILVSSRWQYAKYIYVIVNKAHILPVYDMSNTKTHVGRLQSYFRHTYIVFGKSWGYLSHLINFNLTFNANSSHSENGMGFSTDKVITKLPSCLMWDGMGQSTYRLLLFAVNKLKQRDRDSLNK